MFDELELDIKIDEACNPTQSNIGPFMGIGNRKAKIVFLFDRASENLIRNMDLNEIEGFQILEKVLEFCQISKDDCYFTSLTKYFNKGLITDKERSACMPYLMQEIYLIQPEYIVTVGLALLNFIYKHNTKYEDEGIVVDLNKNLFNTFDFYGIKLVPICELTKISSLNNSYKKKLTQILKEMNK